MFKKTFNRIMPLSTLLFVILFLSCSGPGLIVKLNKYTPQFSDKAELYQYKNKTVFLDDITNNAENTTIWYYYDPSGKICYAGPPKLNSYFWYSFQKALLRVGMHVLDPGLGPPFNTPIINLTMQSITDEQFVFELILKGRGASLYNQTYVITEPPLGVTEPPEEMLEKRAYLMATKVIEKILLDPEFNKAFFSISD